ncbi:MAG: hypothetical protein KF709_14880 [Gemmatimonadaceae bacterium]|nr:hypothetical protein [Gemmatimonadaceae bacterium]
MHVSGDTVLIFDTSRLAVLDRDLNPLRTVAWMESPFNLVELKDGTFVISKDPFHGTSELYHFARDGRRLLAFGDSITRQQRTRYLVVPGAEGGFLSMPELYRLEVHDWVGPGSLRRRILIETPHFAPYETYQRALPDRAPSPTTRGFWADSSGLLWILLEVPRTNWQEGLGPERPALEGGGTTFPIVERGKVWGSVLIVVDPNTARVVAERILEDWYALVVEPWVIASVRQDEDGWYLARLARVEPGTGMRR